MVVGDAAISAGRESQRPASLRVAHESAMHIAAAMQTKHSVPARRNALAPHGTHETPFEFVRESNPGLVCLKAFGYHRVQFFVTHGAFLSALSA